MRKTTPPRAGCGAVAYRIIYRMVSNLPPQGMRLPLSDPFRGNQRCINSHLSILEVFVYIRPVSADDGLCSPALSSHRRVLSTMPNDLQPESALPLSPEDRFWDTYLNASKEEDQHLPTNWEANIGGILTFVCYAHPRRLLLG